jgi:hypothetical protein
MMDEDGLDRRYGQDYVDHRRQEWWAKVRGDCGERSIRCACGCESYREDAQLAGWSTVNIKDLNGQYFVIYICNECRPGRKQ